MSFTPQAITGAYSLNGNGRLKVGGVFTPPSGTTPASYTDGEELNGFKDGTIVFDASTVNNACRSDGGWAKAVAGARSCKVDLTFNKLEQDAAQVGLRAMLTVPQSDWEGKAVALAYTSTDGAATTPSVSGFAGLFVITSYSEKQSGGGDSDATAVECSISLESWGEIAPLTAQPT